MLNRLIRLSVQHKGIVLLFVLFMALIGIWSFNRLPIDAIPDITNNQAQVLTVCPTLATPEVEQFVTAPIENAVKSIPGVIELRSISRFGLSVITVVFREDIDMYLVRQLLNEKLRVAEEMIPAGFGKPELAPISTGLGEILHYRIEPMPGYENRYSPAELRTIQDWIVKKQLIGIPGVVEINSFGGYLKQYEVSVTPERLRAFGLSIQDIFAALESANENSGGGYIEKNTSAYFIRSQGLARSLEDLRKIVVTNSGGIPVLIGDVADVRFGHALRYGAVSHNGKGEIVLGIVMMLKGENAAQVIRNVKARLAEVQKTLPEGITVTTFLDRERLVNRTIDTVERNLIEGALIVIFVLVLLVGNFRAGLIIASVIPLSMLFAITLMEVFGVTANLMSLGAIDFGLIVDGAVIIVEATLHFLHQKAPPGAHSSIRLSQEEMDDSVSTAAGRIMRSSVFGVIIILIVYLPILSLTGIEGKMFMPMAQTVSFALIGALLLSLTYVPAVSALFLSKKISSAPSFADRFIAFLQRLYEPTLYWVLHFRMLVLSITVVLLGISIWLFTRMGGEFIPTLDEGDIMMHGFLRPGTSLTQTLESHRMVQKIILENFPDEVEQVISKIGSAEIPTDPMAIETADNIILLKDKENWTKADTKEELVGLVEEKVHEVPGMAFEFTQPIKMRFDEMMTGVRSDIAVKIFGENLDSLVHAGHRVEALISDIPGVQDLKVEQLEGLPQIVVQYNYPKIARYGLHLRDINETVRAAFAGATAGVVFEDEKRFDLVVRLDTTRRRDLSDVQHLPVATPNGTLIPLSEVATVSYQPGAAQISRDNAQRRIVISANVRERDVESVIRDVQERLEDGLKLPVGYSLKYGGQFENLQAAKARLSIAVPVALALIFILLYFAFNSLKESILIFTAIPLSAVGGVFALLIRDMPFSISAGVGFIALFGVAVLNGIVLIAYFKQLEQEGVHDVYERIRKGALLRLRPVLMTAAVASLGFLPMALSHGAGAEVQRPLATVVIGGLITSTLLTLVVLPILYALFFHRVRPLKPSAATAMVLLLMGLSGLSQAQKPITELEAIGLAQQNHPAIRAAAYRVQEQQIRQGAARDWAPTDFFHNITADPELGMYGTVTFGVAQTFPSRKMTQAQRRYYEQQQQLAQAGRALSEQEITRQIRDIYQHLSYLQSKAALFRQMDSLYRHFADIADARHRSGDMALAEKLALRDQAAQMRLQLETIGHEIAFDQVVLGQLLGLQEPVQTVVEPFHKTEFTLADTALILQSAPSRTGLAQIAVAGAEQQLERAKLSPSVSAGALAQYLANGLFYPGWQVGLSVPLINKSRHKAVEAAGVRVLSAEAAHQNLLLQQREMLAHLLHEQEKYEILIRYYETQGMSLAAELLRSAVANYRAGEMNYVEMVQFVEKSVDIELNQLDNLYGLNRTVIQLRAIVGQ
jgi:cobalt-zinc-cadmium resistance protein CzcA